MFTKCWHNFDKCLTKIIIGPVIKNADIPSKYKPLVGSFANEWTLSIIPDLTIKAPNKLSVNARIDKNIVHAILPIVIKIKIYDFSRFL